MSVRPLHFISDGRRPMYGLYTRRSHDGKFIFFRSSRDGAWLVDVLNRGSVARKAKAFRASGLGNVRFTRLQDAIAALESLYVSV